MERIIELAEQINDKELRKKTIALFKDPSLSNPEMLYTKERFEKCPAWIGAHHNYEGGLIDHTVSVTKISLSLAKVIEEEYKVKINKDHIIAGALLHDIMKVCILKKSGKEWTFTGSVLDHALFSAAELYAKGFPEEVVHIVGSHGGDVGAAGANPRTIEAIIVFYADLLDSIIESQIHAAAQPDLKDMIHIFLKPKEGKNE